MTLGTKMEARIRTRSAPPVETPPVPRQRLRTKPFGLPHAVDDPYLHGSMAPVPRQRVRTVTVDPATRSWVAPHSVDDGMGADVVCGLGEVDNALHPRDWRGWPSGSLYMKGRLHKGRHVLTHSGKYHVLRWDPFTKQYRYVKLAKTHVEAIDSL